MHELLQVPSSFFQNDINPAGGGDENHFGPAEVPRLDQPSQFIPELLAANPPGGNVDTKSVCIPQGNAVYLASEFTTEHARTQRRKDITECGWFRPVEVAPAQLSGSEFDLDDKQRSAWKELSAAFENQGHTIEPEPTRDSDYLITYYQPPEIVSIEDLKEVEPPIAQQVRDEYGLDGLPGNLCVIMQVKDDLRGLPHTEVEELARMAMGRIGAFRMCFVCEDQKTGEEYHAYVGIEGSHPTIAADNPEELRDRMVTHACANEAGGYERVTDVISKGAWAECHTADALVNVGKRLGELGHLDPPMDVELWTSRERAQLVKFLLGWQRQAAGAIIAFAPDLVSPNGYATEPFTGTAVVTCTGRDEVDKTDLQRDEDVVAVALKDGTLYAFGVKERKLKGPSIEGDELVGGMMASTPVRLSEHPEGYVFDPDGDIVVPRIWAIVHTHRGVEELRPISVNGREMHVVEHIRPNVEDFPYAVGCGKDMMFDISRDGMARALAARNSDSPVVVGMFDVANHGTNFFLYCAPRPGTNIIPRDPFENFLNLVNPEAYGAIKLTTEVPQI